MSVKNLVEIVRIKYVPTTDITSGQLVIQGSLRGYATEAIASGVVGSIVVGGQVEVVKATGAWTRGNKIYFDSGNSNYTTVAVGNAFAGIASDSELSSTTVGRVLVNMVTLDDPGPTAANAVVLADNSGGVNPANNVVAAVTNQNTLTDSGGGTADQTVEDVADIALSTTDTYTDAAVNAAVNAAIASISNNFKEWTTEQVIQVAANLAITAAIAQLIAKQTEVIGALVDAGLMEAP